METEAVEGKKNYYGIKSSRRRKNYRGIFDIFLGFVINVYIKKEIYKRTLYRDIYFNYVL